MPQGWRGDEFSEKASSEGVLREVNMAVPCTSASWNLYLTLTYSQEQTEIPEPRRSLESREPAIALATSSLTRPACSTCAPQAPPLHHVVYRPRLHHYLLPTSPTSTTWSARPASSTTPATKLGLTSPPTPPRGSRGPAATV